MHIVVDRVGTPNIHLYIILCPALDALPPEAPAAPAAPPSPLLNEASADAMTAAIAPKSPPVPDKRPPTFASLGSRQRKEEQAPPTRLALDAGLAAQLLDDAPHDRQP